MASAQSADLIFGDANDIPLVGLYGGWDQFGDWNESDLIDVSAFGLAGFADLFIGSAGPGNVLISGGGFNLNVSLDAGESLDTGDFRFS